MKNFNISAVALSSITIIIMLIFAPFSKLEEKVIEIPELSAVSEYKININTADENELAFLKGIGEVTARAIVDYRSEHGEFKSISELDNVYGIGKTKISAWRDLIELVN